MSPNRLASETSPYLLQHADNPVDWFPWGDEALRAARERDVPILLSVGYSACHWCHVMAHESFEDDATAALMNERFVNIKVDREERPDIDGIYMDAVQAMTGRGGWPMTVFLTPEQQPFYAGTYFPPQPHHGLPSFTHVLDGVARAWNEQRADLTTQAEQVIDHLRSRTFASTDLPGVDALDRAIDALAASFDPRWGGFGPAPKFPQPMTLDLLLRMHLRGDVRALPMVQTTLDTMAAGGLFDHVGGGFHRYSVDGRWHVPHFEKMLYDNALLTTAYTRGWLVTRTASYRTAAMRTMTFMLRELQLSDGGFASSLDADTEGHEGRFYTWAWDDLVEIGSEAVAAFLGALPRGNWEGTNVLWTPVDISTTAKEFSLSPEQLTADVTAATERLLRQRDTRERPGIDDKVLAAWNGLAIGALAEGGRVFGDTAAIDAAVRAATFVRDHLCVDGRLMRSWREGATGGPAFLEDHASLATGLLRLYEATGDPAWFAEARSLCDAILDLFIDPDAPGLFQVGSDAPQPVFRPKDLIDSATPSGNSAAALVLLTMRALTGIARYAEVAEDALTAVADPIAHHPGGFAEALCALERATGDTVEIAIVGPPGTPDRIALEDRVWDRYRPNVVLATGNGTDAGDVPLLVGRTMVHDQPTAYVCRGFVCDLPRTEVAELANHLDSLVAGDHPG